MVMKVSKNMRRGALITDLNELVQLAQDRQSVVIFAGGSHYIRPAAFILNWQLSMVLRMKIYHALKDDNE